VDIGYFKFEEKEIKSWCLVVLPNGSSCDTMIATKNPTNLKSHLQKHHKEIFDQMLELENENKNQNQSLSCNSVLMIVSDNGSNIIQAIRLIGGFCGGLGG
jgi:hypothetical protein